MLSISWYKLISYIESKSKDIPDTSVFTGDAESELVNRLAGANSSSNFGDNWEDLRVVDLESVDRGYITLTTSMLQAVSELLINGIAEWTTDSRSCVCSLFVYA